MAWYFIKAEFTMENGERFKDAAWIEADDYIEAAEQARKNRQWDLRDLMRRAEYDSPQDVVYAHFEARRYDVREREPEQVAPVVPLVREETCYCGKTKTKCVEDNGVNCRHPFAAAHMWGD